ncbi:MAG TPA: geranylgeranyl reductase family protein [Streptosporangiaceae bacterium]|nr:geranylgeranyl reductase family protein [Streptosporangiaceae bacterium]
MACTWLFRDATPAGAGSAAAEPLPPVVYAAAVLEVQDWDVAVIGAGPAGLAAAAAAAAAGARTIVLERATHPRYKTCGGGLIGASLAAASGQIAVPVRDHIHAASVTLDGRREFTREEAEPLLAMVVREEFDAALRAAALTAGAAIRERSPVRGISQSGDHACARLADGSSVRASVIVGADGSSGVSGRYTGVDCPQVDLGLEWEIAVPAPVQAQWRGRILLDWGPIPGSYGWVFPKGDRLTVGVIAARGQGERTKRYLRDFTTRLGLGSYQAVQDSGHLTRCRSDGSPLRRGRVLVAGDAAGLLEPWTREGISFALRSGTFAGTVAADAAASPGPEQVTRALDEYAAGLHRDLIPEMEAGRRLLAAFSRHPGAFHSGLATAKGWRIFARFCRSETSWQALTRHRQARMALSLLSRA